ncbi:AAA family ATPase, partial [bacterium]|nr:AAA family ATPase [bacterium]
ESKGFVWKQPNESLKLAMDRLSLKLKVEQQRETKLINITTTSRNPDGIEEIVNSVIRSYIALQHKQTRDENEFKLKYLEEEKKRHVILLDSSYQKLEEVSSKYNTAITEEKNLYVYIETLFDLKKNFNKITIDRINSESRLESLEKTRQRLNSLDFQSQGEIHAEESNLFLDGELQNARKKQEIEIQMIGLKPENPKYTYLQNTLDALNKQEAETKTNLVDKGKKIVRKKLLNENQTETLKTLTDYETAVSASIKLEEELEITQKEVLEFNTAVLRASTQRQEIARLQETLNRISARIEEIQIESFNPGRIFVLAWALPPDGPVQNSLSMMVILSFVAGFVLGCVVAVGIAFFDNTIKRPEDIEKVLGFPVTDYLLNSVNDLIASSNIYTVYRHLPRSYLYEQFRKISLYFEKERSEHDSRVFTVFGVKDGNGSTSFCLNTLAFLDAPKERKLFVDLNYRNPITNQISEISDTKGIIDCLNENGNLEEYVSRDTDLPFCVLTSGRRKTHIPLALNSSQLTEILQNLRFNYDYIFIDAPPLLLSAEASRIALLADVVVLIPKADNTLWAELLRSVDILDKLKIKVLSIILNNVSILSGSYLRNEIDNFYTRKTMSDYLTVPELESEIIDSGINTDNAFEDPEASDSEPNTTQKKQNKFLTVFFIILALIFFGVVGWFTYNHLNKNNEEQQSQKFETKSLQDEALSLVSLSKTEQKELRSNGTQSNGTQSNGTQFPEFNFENATIISKQEDGTSFKLQVFSKKKFRQETEQHFREKVKFSRIQINGENKVLDGELGYLITFTGEF